MNTQIDVSVIEAIGTGAPEAAGTSGGVLASDVGGGRGAVPSVAEAARSEVDEPAEDIIGSIVSGFTTEATEGMVAAPIAPQARGAGGASSGEGLCIHDSDTILNDRVRDTIIQAQEQTINKAKKLLTRGKKLGMYELEFYCPCTHERELCLWYLELVEQMSTSDFELDLYLECHPVQQLNLGVHTQETIQEMPNPNTVELEETVQEIPAQEILVPAPRNPQRGHHEAFHENVHPLSRTASVGEVAVLIGDCTQLLDAISQPSVCPLSRMASVGEVAVLIGDCTQLLDAISQELYMLDQWIHGLGQLTPYGKIDFIFFDFPDGMAPPQGDTPSWNVL
ncbi:hypothetical protein SELMODRAFT_402000 [Selaginella moellendorffii]|uniref:Uncharacterized protein n=1 Tax=Selaginella moellendorffii TaxID=88036 RepID=D8QP96_SELML|nr:hypothetical protein SELMODRAFT_402000 [Selaginella moellendorffii]